jgi:predicted ATPase
MKVGSIVMTPIGRIGLLTAIDDQVALVMSGEEKIYTLYSSLRPASEFDKKYSQGRRRHEEEKEEDRP